jgi:hypothetical protein
MAVREGQVKLTLNVASFKAGMRSATDAVSTAGRQMGKALKEPMNKGISAVKDNMSGMLDDLKGGLKTAATLGGAVSFGAMIRSAVVAKGKYITLAHAVSNYSKANVKAIDIQKAVEGVATDTGETFDELFISANQLTAIPGGMKEFGPTLERATMQAKRLGLQGEFVARVYTRLMAKGLANTAKEAEILTEKINTFGRTVLGIDVDEAIDPMDVAEYAAFVKRMNSGLDESQALISMTGGSVKDLGQALMFFEEMGLALATTEGLDKLRKATKLSKDDINLTKGAVENLLVVLEKKGPSAFKALLESFGPDEAKLALSEVIGKEILIKAEAGKLSKKEWELKIEGIRGELDKAKDATFDYAKIVETDNKLKKGATADFKRAMNILAKAFADEKMMSAIKDLSRHLPVVAEKISGFVQWIIEHPSAAAANYLLIRVAAVFTSAAMKSAATTGMTKLWAVLMAQAAAQKAAGALIPAAGLAGAGAAGLAATAAGVLGAGLAGAAVGGIAFEGLVAPAMEESFDSVSDAAGAMADATVAIRSENIEKKKTAAEALKKQIERAEEGPGFWVSAVQGIKTVGGFFGETEGEKNEKRLREMNTVYEQLTRNIKVMSDAASTAGDSLNKMKSKAEGTATRGSKTLGEVNPGSANTGG